MKQNNSLNNQNNNNNIILTINNIINNLLIITIIIIITIKIMDIHYKIIKIIISIKIIKNQFFKLGQKSKEINLFILNLNNKKVLLLD